LPIESVYPPIGTPISWVISPPRRRSPVAWITERAHRLLVGRPATEIDVLRVSAFRA